MKKYISICAVCLAFAAAGVLYSQSADVVRFAVSPFTSLTVDAEKENAGKEASHEIEEGLSAGKWFELRKSGEIESFLERLEFAQAGGGNVDEVAAMGKNLQIKYLTVGSVAKFGSHYEVDSRSVNIDNWTIVHSSGCSAADLDGACGYINKDVAITLTKDDLAARETNAKNAPTIAVYRFNDANQSAQDTGYGGAFSEVLNSELGAHDGFIVMERTHLKAVIDAKEMEMCGIYGADSSDSYFSVRGIVYKAEGEIRLFPDVVCINYGVVDTRSNRKVYMGYSEISTIKGLRPLARRLAKDIDDAINRRIGTLDVKSEPAGADLFLDGQPFGKTPVVVSFASGPHDLKLSYPGYETLVQQVDIPAARVMPRSFTLAKVSRALYDTAYTYELKKDWKRALESYDEFIKKYSDSEDANQAIYRKGHIQLFYLKDTAGALESFSALIKRYPDSMTRAEAYFGIARTYKEMGKEDMVKQTLSVLTEKFPSEVATEEAKNYFKVQ